MLEILMCVWRKMKFEAELVMMRNDEGKFKWLECKGSVTCMACWWYVI